MDKAVTLEIFGFSGNGPNTFAWRGERLLEVELEKRDPSAVRAVRLMTLREVAEYLRVHPGTVYRLVKSGQLPAARVGRDLRFDTRLVEQWIAKGGTGAARGRRHT